jgi:hypothetical protein
MRTRNDVCGPDELKVLQQIFDSIWLQLEHDGRVRSDDQGVRLGIAARVIACAKDRDLLDFEAISSAVLGSLH